MIRYFWPSDDEQLAGQQVDSHISEDADWWVGVQKCGATLALAVTLALTTVSTSLATSVFTQHQDDPAGFLNNQLAVDEVYWQNPVAPVNWPQPAVKIDDDIHVQFVAVQHHDEDFWQNQVPPVPATNFVKLPFLDPDFFAPTTAAIPVVDEADFSIPPPWEPNWTLMFWLDDGSTVPFFQYDEDFWVNPVAPYNWPQPQQPFAASDDDNQSPQFPANEDFWPSYVAPVPDGLIWPQPFVWEQDESPTLFSPFVGSDTDYWLNPVLPVPDSIWLLRQDNFEQTDATGALFLNLYDDFVPTLVVPVPDGLLLVQQWPFDEFESTGSLRNNVDEDFWINPVQPVNWTYPILPNLDEVIQTFVPLFQPDEDRWEQLVFPVVAQNTYNQPFSLLGQQEDDTPVLVPFIPPPPPFCPLPPTGPDTDVKMSTFGGTKPTLVLFCRICKSGKPLVVRADYAIWCQDCCAFVSKQDTYMGTVQSPGQFRSIF